MLKTRKLLSKGLKSKIRGIKPKKVPKGLPAWLKAIPEGVHGSGTEQKRLWRLTSDYVRIRDFQKYGKCIATDQILNDWNDGQAGHYRSYSECNGIFKFNPLNIHLQTANSNGWPTSKTWETFARNLKERYGSAYIYDLDAINFLSQLKITRELTLKWIEFRLIDLGKLLVKPPYYERVMKLKLAAEHLRSA